MKGWDGDEEGMVWIGDGDEVVIDVKEKGDYRAWSNSGEEILQITEDDNGINSIT